MQFLNKEYSKYTSDNKAWKNALFISSVILLLFLLFQPFGFRDKELGLKLILFPGYAFLTYLYNHFDFYIVRILLKKKKSWTIKDELVNLSLSIVLLTFVIHIYTYFASTDMPFSFQWYFILLYHTASIFLLITIIEFFYYNHRAASSHNIQLSSQYEDVKHKLDLARFQTIDAIPISLEKEQIEINRDKLVYVQSVGNYLEFSMLEINGKINKITKRGRLHQVEKDLSLFPEFYKCHRAFIINCKHVTNLTGNIKNTRVVFDGVTDKIPVSRQYYKILKEKFEKIVLS